MLGTFMEVYKMLGNVFIDNAKVMAKGQITIPKDVREVLGVSNGDRVSFIVENGNVRIVNSAVYAMQMLQNEMRGEAKKAGLDSDEDIMAMVKEMRQEDEQK
jgi:AbrB family looped-hinge helix DNA binding protein